MKKLQNIVNILFGKPWKMSRGFTYLENCIVPQILRQNTRRYFSHNSKMFFPVQNNFSIKRWKNFVLLLLKSKLEWNLNDLPIFQLSRAVSMSIHGKNYGKALLYRSIEELQSCLEYWHFLILQPYSRCKGFYILS